MAGRAKADRNPNLSKHFQRPQNRPRVDIKSPGSLGAQELNMPKLIRQAHRWLSMVFTLTVIANFVALGIGQGQQPPAWITYSPLLPLFLLMFSGLYLFFLPYLAKRRTQ